jgi:hypothetical protein
VWRWAPALGTFALACQSIVSLSSRPASDAAIAAPEVIGTVCGDPGAIHAPQTGSPEQAKPFTIVLGYGSFTPTPDPDAGVELCPSAGYDLDDKSTCFDDAGNQHEPRDCTEADAVACSFGPSCNNPNWDSVAKWGRTCDLPTGEDNAVGLAFRSLGPLVPAIQLADVDLPKYLRSGQGNLMVTVSGYNEQADDPNVTLAILRSSGIVATGGRMPETEPDGAIPMAEPVAWDGNSVREWYVDPESYLVGGIPREIVTGFVKDYVLVVRAGHMSLPSSFQLEGETVTLTGELRKRTDGWALVRGRIGGRISTHAALQQMGILPIKHANDVLKPLCEDDFFSVLRSLLCKTADLGDGECNYLSIGLGFVAVPGVVGPTRARSQVPEPCPTQVDDCN